MTKKLKFAIFDKDLKARDFGKYPVSQDGSKISIRRGGKRNFNPTFDNESFIEFPRRSLMPPFKTVWDRIYFVRNGAKKCVNFKTEEVLEPDPEIVIEAAKNTILQQIGSEKKETPLTTYIMLGILIIIALKVFGVLV